MQLTEYELASFLSIKFTVDYGAVSKPYGSDSHMQRELSMLGFLALKAIGRFKRGA